MPPLERTSVQRAPEAALRAKADVARALGQPEEERAALRELATWLSARRVDPAAAVKAAERALQLEDEPALRAEVARWLSRLGAHARAAEQLALVPTELEDTASAVVAVATSRARAGDPAGACADLARAIAADPQDPLPLELLGAIAGGDSGAIARDAGASAYLQAAALRRLKGAVDEELADVLRAFELSPESPAAYEAVAAGYRERGRARAADDALRAHAFALGAKGDRARSRALHARRRNDALAAGDVARALAAALDEGLDSSGLDADFDELLARAALYEVLAVRLELRAEREGASSGPWLELARLLGGPLADSARAAYAYARAVEREPDCEDALRALESLGEVGRALTREALVACARSEEERRAIPASRRLARMSDEVGEEALAHWAWGRVAELAPSDDEARAALSRLPAPHRVDAEIELLVQSLAVTAGEPRAELVAQLVRLLAQRPSARAQRADAAAELLAAGTDDDASAALATLVFDGAEEALSRAIERLAAGRRAARARVALATLVRRRGDLVAAVEALAPAVPFAHAGEAAPEEDAPAAGAGAALWALAALADAPLPRAAGVAASAASAPPLVAGALYAFASEVAHREGAPPAAERWAAEACRVDPQGASALAARARAGGADVRALAPMYERVAASSGVRAEFAREVSSALARAGETDGAARWAARWVSLAPGDAAAVSAFLDAVARVGDAARIADAIGWALAQPLSADLLSPPIARALPALATLDAEAAEVAAVGAADQLGPQHPALRGALAEVARRSGRRRPLAAVLEAWIGTLDARDDRAAALVELASVYAASHDTAGEARAWIRAARDGADLAPVGARLDAFAATRVDENAELWVLELRARHARAHGTSREAALAFRAWGAALWDAADDRAGALSAWIEAARLAPTRGFATLRGDVEQFAGSQYALDYLAEMAEQESDGPTAAMLATEAARSALAGEAHSRAITLSKLALERAPGYAAALETAEQACAALGRVQEMSPIYDAVAKRALGRYGRRAAHHRGARFFEARGAEVMALKHAAQAFVAVPSEGGTLAILQRTAERAGRRRVAVRTIEHVAELAKTPGARAQWLLRAASLAGDDDDGLRQRVDLLLRAAILIPTPSTLSMLADAARPLVTRIPEERDALAMRLARATEALSKKLDGPDGARVYVTFAELAIDVFGDAEWAWSALGRATAADADIEEYAALVRHAAALSKDPAIAEAGLARGFAEVDKPYANVGTAFLRLLGAVAAAIDDAQRRARALVLACEKEPDDEELVVAADAAAVAAGDAALSERLNKRVGVFRRTEALRHVATEAVKSGAAPRAVALLERASEIAPPESRAAVAAELADALSASGRPEDGVLRRIASPDLSAAERAALWDELARLREASGDLSGATDAALQAVSEDGSEVARLHQLERLAELSGREHVRAEALRSLCERETGAERIACLKRLARAEGARGALAAAEAAWRELWGAAPEDGEADVAIEALLVARGSYDELADHLRARSQRLAADPAARETLRAVRLRRAALLEQRLGRPEDACRELEQLLAETPDNESAQRYLADLYERIGDPVRAVALLDRIAEQAESPTDRAMVRLRQARGYAAVGDLPRATSILRAVSEALPDWLPAVELRVELARQSQDPRELGDALAAYARVGPDDAATRSDVLIEAAQAAARASDTGTALERAQDAARLSPESPAAQLFARGLEYRVRGVGTPEDARHTIEMLARLSGPLDRDDVALRAFLMAESLEAIGDPAAAKRILLAAEAEAGTDPLLALGLAEREVAAGDRASALRHYGVAVEGNLLGLRRQGDVALAAADIAREHGDDTLAARLLNEAAKEPELRGQALRRLAALAFEAGDVARGRGLLRSVLEYVEGEERAEVLAELAEGLAESPQSDHRLEAQRILEEAKQIDSKPPARVEPPAPLETRPRTPAPPAPAEPRPRTPAPPAPVEMRPRTPAPPAPQAPAPSAEHAPASSLGSVVAKIAEAGGEVGSPAPFPSPPPVLTALPEESIIQSLREPPALGASIRTAGDPRIEQARALASRGERREAEKLLAEAVQGGSADAADALGDLLVDEPGRIAHLVRVRRQAVELSPGDLPRLRALITAAERDQNRNYARAIEHVVRAFDRDAEPLAPPPLSAQSEQPGMLGLLTRHAESPGNSAMGLLWEGASSVFVRSAASVLTSGLDRIVPGPATPLSRLYEVAMRLLDVPRCPLYVRRSAEPPTTAIALMSTPSAILTGDVREDRPELRWALGEALSGVLPANALLLGLGDEERVRTYRAVVSAFGPPTAGLDLDKATAELATQLWQTVPGRSQRRLQELMAEARGVDLGAVVERARQNGRRVALFLTGDIGYAARRLMPSPEDTRDLFEAGGLARACKSSSALADLLRLAVRPEYADARWHVPSPASMRFTLSNVGRVPVV